MLHLDADKWWLRPWLVVAVSLATPIISPLKCAPLRASIVTIYLAEYVNVRTRIASLQFLFLFLFSNFRVSHVPRATGRSRISVRSHASRRVTRHSSSDEALARASKRAPSSRLRPSTRAYASNLRARRTHRIENKRMLIWRALMLSRFSPRAWRAASRLPGKSLSFATLIGGARGTMHRENDRLMSKREPTVIKTMVISRTYSVSVEACARARAHCVSSRAGRAEVDSFYIGLCVRARSR